jgi:hypothetical protein
MKILDSTRKFAVIFAIGFSIVNFRGYAETLYVDNKLAVKSTRTYSISGRNSNGNNGKAFSTIQMALDSMKTGDVICIRGGVYLERKIKIPLSKNGTSWNPGKFNTMTSFPGEWAIIDGQKNIIRESGRTPFLLGNSDGPSMKFWKFERLEIRNGATADDQNAAGFFGNHGPFIFRYCVFRDNIVGYEGNNPGAIMGYTWMDCLVEYCYFYNNGAKTNHKNSAHIVIFADYNEDTHAEKGFTNVNYHTMGNRYRNNLFVSASGPAVAIKYKNDTFLSGRNPSAGKGYDDKWKERGDHINHNIFRKTLDFAIDGRQDFMQIYNNIFDSCYGAITVGEWWKPTIYRAVVFNNTVLGRGKQGLQFNHFKMYPFQEPAIVQYAYNNIVSYCGDDWLSCDITLLKDPNFTNAIIDSFKIDRNFIYNPATNPDDPNGTYVFWFGYSSDATKRHTLSDYNKRFPNTKLYYAKADASNPLFRGNSGIDRLITRGEYKLSTQETIANAGKNIRHPFLNGMVIPEYIGATDPKDSNNNKWVSDVMNLVNLGNGFTPDTVSQSPVPENNAPSVSHVSAAKNTAQITDSVVTVRWKAQDDQGVTVCSLFVSVNDSSYRPIAVKNNSLDSIIWNIPDEARSVKFLLRVYDAMGKYGEGESSRYFVSIIREAERQMRLYAYNIDGSSVFAAWGSYLNETAFRQIAVVCRTDRFAASPTENGSKVHHSNLSKGSAVLSGFTNGQNCYISIFGELNTGNWSTSLDSVQIKINGMAALGRSAFSDTLYVPEDGSDSVSHTLYCFKGNSDVLWAKGSIVTTNKIVNGKRAIEFTVPSVMVCDTSGFYAYLIRSTSKYSDTVRISRPVKRLNSNCDDFITSPGKRHPVSVTALPVKYRFADAINYLKSPENIWEYDRERAVITQFKPLNMENPKSIYYEYGQIEDSLFDLVPGRLFWVHSEESLKFDFGQAVIPALYQDYTLKIDSGWTHFALPAAIPVTLDQVMNATGKVWTDKLFDSLEIYRWRKTANGYSVQSIHLPGMRTVDPDQVIMCGGVGTGFAVYNRSTKAKSLIIPIIKNPLIEKVKPQNPEDNRWSICLNARLNRGDSLPSAYFGYSSDSDPITYQQAPSMDKIRIMIKDANSGNNCSHLLVNNIDKERLAFDVAIINGSSVADTVIFAIGARAGLPQNVNLAIIDGRNGMRYSGSDSVMMRIEPEETVYLTIETEIPSTVLTRTNYHSKYGISKLVQNRFTNKVKVEFNAPSTVSKVTVSLYTLTGKAMVRESRFLGKSQNVQSIDLPLSGHSVSNGNYIIKLTMKDDKGAEMQFKAPVLLMNN